MKIPLGFGLRFWAKRTLLSVGTFLLMAYFIFGLSLLAIPFAVILIFLFFYWQYVIFSHFRGRRRGAFEYLYREHLVQKAAKAIIKRFVGIPKYVRLWVDEFNRISALREDVLNSVLAHPDVMDKPELEFPLLVKLARSARREDDFQKEAAVLETAILKKPGDVVANYRLGNAYEKLNDPTRAIGRYEVALHNAQAGSPLLREFIEKQVARVNSRGPCQKPPMPGLKYLSW